MPPERARATLTGLIGRDMHLHGAAEFEGALLVEGRVTGEIRSRGSAGRLVVDRHGVVHGPVHVGEADIAGRVEGDVYAAVAVRVRRDGHVIGQVHAPSVRCEPGARVDGEVHAAGRSRPADRH